MEEDSKVSSRREIRAGVFCGQIVFPLARQSAASRWCRVRAGGKMPWTTCIFFFLVFFTYNPHDMFDQVASGTSASTYSNIPRASNLLPPTRTRLRRSRQVLPAMSEKVAHT
jgi:hypothetical protein